MHFIIKQEYYIFGWVHEWKLNVSKLVPCLHEDNPLLKDYTVVNTSLEQLNFLTIAKITYFISVRAIKMYGILQ